MSDKAKWVIREAVEADLAFIYATWLNSYRVDSYVSKFVGKSKFYSSYARVIDYILEQDSTEVRVAVLPDEVDVILGYLVMQPNIIHYVFVKEGFRKFGICSDLCIYAKADKPVTFTHRTRLSESILEFRSDLIYDPFLLFKQGELHV